MSDELCTSIAMVLCLDIWGESWCSLSEANKAECLRYHKDLVDIVFREIEADGYELVVRAG